VANRFIIIFQVMHIQKNLSQGKGNVTQKHINAWAKLTEGTDIPKQF